MQKLYVEGLPQSYYYEVTVLGYFAAFHNGVWITTVSHEEDAIAALSGRHAELEE